MGVAVYKYMCLSWLKQEAKWLLIAAVEWEVKVKVNLFIVGSLWQNLRRFTSARTCQENTSFHNFLFHI